MPNQLDLLRRLIALHDACALINFQAVADSMPKDPDATKARLLNVKEQVRLTKNYLNKLHIPRER